MKKNQDINEDDGRTVADMSQVSGGHLFGRHHRYSREMQSGPGGFGGSQFGSGGGFGGQQSGPGEGFGGQQSRWEMQRPRTEERPWENAPFTRKERWMYTLGALKASLLIGLVYLAGLGLLVGLMVFFWK